MRDDIPRTRKSPMKMCKPLLASGWSEEEVFEFTAAAAISAGYGGLPEIAWQALAEAQARQSAGTG